jgi:hypothetical protein
MDNVQHISILNQLLTNLSRAVQFQTIDGAYGTHPRLKKYIFFLPTDLAVPIQICPAMIRSMKHKHMSKKWIHMVEKYKCYIAKSAVLNKSALKGHIEYTDILHDLGVILIPLFYKLHIRHHVK